MSLANKVQQFIVDSDVAHDIVHGDEQTVVQTEGGPVRSLAKLISDSEEKVDAQLLYIEQIGAKDGAGKVGYGSRTAKDILDEKISMAKYMTPEQIIDGSLRISSLICTDAIQQALDEAMATGKLFEPIPGMWQVHGDGLRVHAPIRIFSPGLNQCLIRNLNGTVLRLEGEGIDVEGVGLYSASGGHTVRQTGLLSQSNWRNNRIIQDDPNYSCWDNDGHEYVDVRHTGFDYKHVLGATVPGFNLTAVGGLINDNLFADGRATNSGKHFFRVRSTTANHQFANFFHRVTFEVCRGGGIDLQAVKGFEIVGCQNWDAGTGNIADHFYRIELNGSGIGSMGKISQCGRWDGSYADGFKDVKLPSSGGGAGVVIEDCFVAGVSDPFTIDDLNNGIIVRGNTLMQLMGGAGSLVQRNTGFTFPGSNAELGSYGEGDWTPAIGSAGTFTYATQVGKWTRIGRQVTVQGNIGLASASGASGTLVITGLPFPIPNNIANYGAVQVFADGLDASAVGQVGGVGVINNSSIVLLRYSAGIQADIATALKAGSSFKFSYTYFVS